MTTSTSPSLAEVIHVVGPNILSFLSEKDILCSLQYASRDIWLSCSNASERWRNFIRRYFLGRILQQRSLELGNTLRLITAAESDLVDLSEIPNNVLYSMIAGIVPAKNIEDPESL